MENHLKTEDEENIDKVTKKGTTRRNIVLGVLLLICLAVSLTVGLVLHFQKKEDIPEPKKIIQIRNGASVNCHPDHLRDPTQIECENRGCLWSESVEERVPKCVYKAENTGYIANITQTPTGYTARLRRRGISRVYGMDIHEYMNVNIETYSTHALRIKFYPDGKFYEVPEEALTMNKVSGTGDRLYNVTIVREPYFGIAVTRISTGVTIFNTTLPGLMFSEQYIQMSTKLPSEYVYGFGEHNHRRLLHDMNWKTWSIFTRDVAPVDGWNLYGAQPTYMNLEEDGNANLVFLRNSNGMEVDLQPKPNPAITYRVIGGILDFYIFLGPTPEKAVQQYTEAIGRPMMPPYWSLGFHLCRWGYENLTTLRTVHDRMVEAGVPQDVQWGDIDYMYEHLDFTYDRVRYQGLPDFVKQLHDGGQKYIVMADPGIGADPELVRNASINSPGYYMYADGVNNSVFIMTADGKLMRGNVWPGETVFPDFSNFNTTVPYWQKWINFFRKEEGVEIDGLWVDMNEPANFIGGQYDDNQGTGCERNKWNYPPFIPNVLGRGTDGRLFNKTFCMDAKQHWGIHYDVHSLYGHSMSMVTHKALRNISPRKRPFILTRSNFPGTAKYAAHWLGDNQSQWRQIPWSIIGMLEYSIFGFTMVGADVCGFWFGITPELEELCLRWTQLGAFYPFARNHNAVNFRHQDPAAFGDKFAEIARSVLMTRYKFLPYIYTLMFHGHAEGKTVARPLLFEFPQDKATLSIDRQFLLGPAFMVTPVLVNGSRTVDCYFPEGRWFDYYTGHEIQTTKETVVLDAPLEKINLHIRGGYVLPWQQPANNTVHSRGKPMGLLVALDENHRASGDLFWDDGDSFETREKGEYLHVKFETAKSNFLSIEVIHNGTVSTDGLAFETIELYGLSRIPAEVKVNGRRVGRGSVRYQGANEIVQIFDQHLPIDQNHTLSWIVF
ncbi:hypothetical protein ScPMuIL_018046 [Solemya velum]